MTTTSSNTITAATYLYPDQLHNGVYFEAVAGCCMMGPPLPDVIAGGELAQMDVYLQGEQVAALLFHPVPELLGHPFALVVGDELYCFYRLRKKLAAGLVLQPGRFELMADRIV